jgi:hypothetical protein
LATNMSDLDSDEDLKNYNIRSGCGIKYQMVHPSCLGQKTVTGFKVDNLDKKMIDQAESEFEKLFILIRMEMEKNESRCMDNEDDRLALCQAVSDRIYKDLKSSLERKEK